MRKNILYTLVVTSFMLLLTACGTDSKENPNANGPYAFFNATTPITVNRSGTMTCSSCINNGITSDSNSSVIAVQLLKNGVVEPGQIVQMLPFDFKYGFISNYVVTTDANGYAVFSYQPAENYDDIIGQDITIQAVFLDPEDIVVSSTDTPRVLLTQDFVLQFR